MAYVTQPTWVTGQLVTAACLTQYSSNDEYLKGRAGSIAFENGAAFSGSMSLAGDLTMSTACTGGLGPELVLINTGGGSNDRGRLSFNSGAGSGTQRAALDFEVLAGGNGVVKIIGGPPASQIEIARFGNNAANGASVLYIGDTDNAKMGAGLTINQGACTTNNEIISLKASGIAHGVTTVTETDTYGFIRPVVGAQGGVDIWGICQTSATDSAVLHGVAAFDRTTKATNEQAYVRLEANKYSGSTLTSPGANANILGVSSGTGVLRLIVDAEGDVHADAAVTASAYDAYNDIGLVRALELFRAPETTVREVWDEWVKYSRADLQRLKIATFNDHPGGDGSIFINYSALTRLHSGALWQMHKRLAEVERWTERIETLLATPSRVRGWIGRAGRRLLGRRDRRPATRRG